MNASITSFPPELVATSSIVPWLEPLENAEMTTEQSTPLGPLNPATASSPVDWQVPGDIGQITVPSRLVMPGVAVTVVVDVAVTVVVGPAVKVAVVV